MATQTTFCRKHKRTCSSHASTPSPAYPVDVASAIYSQLHLHNVCHLQTTLV